MNKFEIIKERIEDIAPGQILAYFRFYNVQKEKSYAVFKNNQHLTIVVFKSRNDQVSFIETLGFTQIDKTELFYFLLERFDVEAVIETLAEIVEIEEYYSFVFEQTADAKRIVNAYFNLEHNPRLEGTSLETIGYSRHGRDCVLFLKDKNPVDVVVFDESNNLILSEFGNNSGTHVTNRPGSSSAVVTYNPSILINQKMEKHHTVLTKYLFSAEELLKTIGELEVKKIIIPVVDSDSRFYKLYFLTTLYNFFHPSSRFYTVTRSPNTQYIDLTVYFKGGIKEKISVINGFAKLQNEIKRHYKDAPETLLDVVQKHYNIHTDIYTEKNNHVGHVVFRNKQQQFEIISSFFIEELEALEDFYFKVE